MVGGLLPVTELGIPVSFASLLDGLEYAVTGATSANLGDHVGKLEENDV